MEKYEHFMLRGLEKVDENADEIYKVCPLCETGAFIPRNLKEVYCGKPGCKYRFCPLCFDKYHPKLTCKQQR